LKAAIVLEAGKAPVYSDFKDPIPAKGESLITVSAAALSHVVKSRASGTHYSSSGDFPFVVGIDGVGRLEDGRRVYFVMPTPHFGSMAEKTVANISNCIILPDGLDDVTAAAIANPGMSAWAAYKERAKLVAGETVLVNGATGTAGQLAVQIAKYLGAKKVIATGRNIEVLKSLKAKGADVTIPLVEDADALEEAFIEQFGGDGVDVILDYLWGQSAQRLLIAGTKAGREAVPIRFVHIGSASDSNIILPSAVLRSSAIELMGSGIGSIPMNRLVNAIGELLQATVPGGFEIATKAVPLSELEEAWLTDTIIPRTVFTIGSKGL
jgi:NADPH:quinone reductase-like Zn-dependent oxidoreductase